ncbi:MAG: AraC family transcriptional regulator, positive regulator of tynA and feaB [Trebonia sp.]|nr:AraC family transcriptional regulator, positive regulator of tynA and feaB [Trebonia sp.]
MAHASTVRETARDLTPAGLQGARDALLQLAKGALVREFDDAEPLLAPALARAAMEITDRRLASPDLSPASLARELNVSVRCTGRSRQQENRCRPMSRSVTPDLRSLATGWWYLPKSGVHRSSRLGCCRRTARLPAGRRQPHMGAGTEPAPVARVPGNHAGPRGGHREMHSRLRPARQAGTHRQRGPSVAVRRKPTVTPTVLARRTPSAICPWTPQRNGLQRDKVTHAGTEKKRPASGHHHARMLAGHYPRQGSSQRRPERGPSPPTDFPARPPRRAGTAGRRPAGAGHPAGAAGRLPAGLRRDRRLPGHPGRNAEVPYPRCPPACARVSVPGVTGAS